jgi:hypothetical protein
MTPFEPFPGGGAPQAPPPIKVRWLNRDWIPASWRATVAPGTAGRGLWRLGLAVFVLFLLGAFPWLQSPVDRLLSAVAAHDQRADVASEAQLRALQTMCVYMVPEAARHECLGGEPAPLRPAPRPVRRPAMPAARTDTRTEAP